MEAKEQYDIKTKCLAWLLDRCNLPVHKDELEYSLNLLETEKTTKSFCKHVCSRLLQYNIIMTELDASPNHYITLYIEKPQIHAKLHVELKSNNDVFTYSKGKNLISFGFVLVALIFLILPILFFGVKILEQAQVLLNLLQIHR